MKIRFWISTSKIGSECEGELEIDDEELQGMTKAEQDIYITAEAREAAFEWMDWGWEEI